MTNTRQPAKDPSLKDREDSSINKPLSFPAEIHESNVHRARNPSKRTCVIVLGMHRSGTSALTRVLNLLGCDLPKTLMKASQNDNDLGFWESQKICDFNEKVLASAGSCWDDWLAFNPGWFFSPKIDEFREEAQRLIDEEFGASRFFVLKDPRICRIAPFWIQTLEAAGILPRIIISIRNPLEVGESLQSRNGIEPTLSHLIWLRHVLDAEFQTRGMTRFFSSYDGLMKNWTQLAEGAAETLKLSWPRLSDKSVEEIEAFLSEKYHRQRIASENIIENPRISSWLREGFQIVRDWAVLGEKKEDYSLLDSIRAEFDRASPAFSRVISEGRQAKSRVRILEKTTGEMQAKLEDKESEKKIAEQALVVVQAKLKDANDATVSAREQAVEKDKRISVLQAELESREQAAEAAQSTLAEAQSQLRAAETVTAERQARIDSLEGEVTYMRDQVGEKEKQISDLQAGLETQANLVNELQTSLNQAHEELSQKESALKQQYDTAEKIAKEFTSSREELRQLTAIRVEQNNILEGFKEHIHLLMEDVKNRHASYIALEESYNEKIKLKDIALAKKEQQINEIKDALETLREEMSKEIKTQTNELAHIKQVYEKLKSENEKAEKDYTAELQNVRSEVIKIRSENHRLEARLKERFEEIATLTNILKEKEKNLDLIIQSRDCAISALLDDAHWPFLWNNAKLKRKMAYLKRYGLFDPEWYLNYYKDVAEAKVDPLRHYVEYGFKEGRKPDGLLEQKKITK